MLSNQEMTVVPNLWDTFGGGVNQVRAVFPRLYAWYAKLTKHKSHSMNIAVSLARSEMLLCKNSVQKKAAPLPKPDRGSEAYKGSRFKFVLSGNQGSQAQL